VIFQWNTLDINEQIWLITQLSIAIILIVMGIYFFGQSVKFKEVKSQRYFYLGLSLFVAFNTVTQVLWTVDKWTIDLMAGTPPSDGSIVVDFNLPFIGGGAFIPYLFMLFLWSFAAVCWPVEKFVRNSKHFPLTTINLAAAISMTAYIFVVSLFFPGIVRNDASWKALYYPMIAICVLGILGTLLFILLIVGFYMVLGFKTSGSIRKKSLLIAFGFICVFVGLALTQVSKGYGPWVSLLSPSVMLVGFAFLVTGYRIQV
jgi:hypothetical protein